MLYQETKSEFDRPAHAGYGIEHKPLMVTPVKNKHRPDEPVAFINRQLCFFERTSVKPVIGVPVEVMIVKAMYKQHNAATTDRAPAIDDRGREVYGLDYSRVSALVLRVVTPDYVLMAINGFECSGFMCRTTASGFPADSQAHYTLDEILREKPMRNTKTLTPGRTGIREASNVNAGRTRKVPYTPLTPTNVYVEKALLDAGGICRIEGLTRIEDAEYRHALAK